MHVAIYARGRSRWALDEGPIARADRQRDAIAISRSSMRYEGGRLVIELNETSPILKKRIRGRIVVEALAPSLGPLPITASGEHLWWPTFPAARALVTLDEPDLRFEGHAYHDANWGLSPLHTSFDTWSWARARRADGGAIVTYDTVDAQGRARALALEIGARGDVRSLDGTTWFDLGRGLWGVARPVRADVGSRPRIARALEDTPFYTRSLVHASLGGAEVTAVHEFLSAERLRAGWVRHLLGYRMGRRR